MEADSDHIQPKDLREAKELTTLGQRSTELVPERNHTVTVVRPDPEDELCFRPEFLQFVQLGSIVEGRHGHEMLPGEDDTLPRFARIREDDSRRIHSDTETELELLDTRAIEGGIEGCQGLMDGDCVVVCFVEDSEEGKEKGNIGK